MSHSPTFQGLLIKKIRPLTSMGVMDYLKKSAEVCRTKLHRPAVWPSFTLPYAFKKKILQNYLTTFMLKKWKPLKKIYRSLSTPKMLFSVYSLLFFLYREGCPFAWFTTIPFQPLLDYQKIFLSFKMQRKHPIELELINIYSYVQGSPSSGTFQQ